MEAYRDIAFEATLTIHKYQMLDGPGAMTWFSIEDMEYHDFVLVQTCKSCEIKAQEKASESVGKSHNAEHQVRYEDGVNFPSGY